MLKWGNIYLLFLMLRSSFPSCFQLFISYNCWLQLCPLLDPLSSCRCWDLRLFITWEKAGDSAGLVRATVCLPGTRSYFCVQPLLTNKKEPCWAANRPALNLRAVQTSRSERRFGFSEDLKHYNNPSVSKNIYTQIQKQLHWGIKITILYCSLCIPDDYIIVPY